MNLFEAKHVLQKVGYTVAKDYDAEACTLIESAIHSIARHEAKRRMFRHGSRFINEMAARRADSELAAAVERDIASIDSKRSNYNNGRAKSPSMGNCGLYLKHFDALKAAEDTLSDRDLHTLDRFERDGYLAACENDDISLVKKVNNMHGSKNGRDIFGDIEAGDVKEALKKIKNSIRSGGSEIARKNIIAKIDKILSMEKIDDTTAQYLQAAREKLEAGEFASKRLRTNNDSYTITVPKKKNPAFVLRVLRGNGVEGMTNEDGTITFATTEGKANKIIAGLKEFGITDVVKAEREMKTANATVTKTFTIDDVDSVNFVLKHFDAKNFDAKVNKKEMTVEVTGTESKIAKFCMAMDDVGLPYEEVGAEPAEEVEDIEI